MTQKTLPKNGTAKYTILAQWQDDGAAWRGAVLHLILLSTNDVAENEATEVYIRTERFSSTANVNITVSRFFMNVLTGGTIYVQKDKDGYVRVYGYNLTGNEERKMYVLSDTLIFNISATFTFTDTIPVAATTSDLSTGLLPRTSWQQTLYIRTAAAANTQLVQGDGSLVAKSTFATALNRTVGGNDDATVAVTDTGGALSVPLPVTVVAPAASATQTTAGTRTLRAQLKILIDNIANLFSRMGTAETNIAAKAADSQAVNPGTTEDTTKITASTTKTVNAWFVALLQKINGLITAVGTKQATLSRTVGGNDNATGTVSDTGGNLSVPLPLTLTAAAATATQNTATAAQSLRTWAQSVRNNIAQLFNGLSTETTSRTNADTTLYGVMSERVRRTCGVTVGFDNFCDFNVNNYASADPAIQAAVDFLGSNGGTVTIQNGWYTFKGYVTINNNNITIRGQTCERVYIIYDSAYTGNLFRVIGTSSESVYHIRFEKLTFYGSNSGVDRDIIYLYYAASVYIYRCNCRDIRGHFLAGYYVYVCTVMECYAYNIYKNTSNTTGWAYFYESGGLIIVYNQIMWVEAHKLFFYNCSFVIINGNNFQNHGLVKFTGSENYYISVMGNIFEHAGLVMPSSCVIYASVTGNVRYGSAETDLSGAEVVFGNKGFGEDKTENNLIVGGELVAKNATLGHTSDANGNGGDVYLRGSIYFENIGNIQNGKYKNLVYPTANPMQNSITVSGNWTIPRGWYVFTNNDQYRYALNNNSFNFNGPSSGNIKITTAEITTLYYSQF